MTLDPHEAERQRSRARALLRDCGFLDAAHVRRVLARVELERDFHRQLSQIEHPEP